MGNTTELRREIKRTFARQLGKVFLIDCAELQIDEVPGCVRIGEHTLQVGDLLTLDGNDGTIYAGTVQTEVKYPEDLLARQEILRGLAP